MRLLTKEDFFNSFKNQNHVEQLKQIPQRFNIVHNEEKKVTEITIYGVIGFSWWSESFSENDLDEALNQAGDNDIYINLNSPGGDAFGGISIFNRLKRHPGKVTIHVDGWACSAASIIAMAADELIMGLGAMYMIHEASNIVWGTKQDMRKEADVLEELEEGLIDIYMTKTKLSREDVRAKMDAETWFSAASAVEAGFADKAAGVETEQAAGAKNTLLSPDKKKGILNELHGILNTQRQQVEPELSPVPSNDKEGSFNLLKKWR